MYDYKYDLWVFSYQWEREKDEVATVEFYTSSEISGDNDEIIIDVRLRVVKDANKTETGTVSLDVKNLRNMLKSVSYTHLDVYKRQSYIHSLL